MMNATAGELSALGERKLTCLQASQAVADYWSQAVSLRSAIYNCCLAYMNGNAADAQDASQDVLIHGSEKYPESAGKIKNFSAWLLRVTKNFCISLLRKKAKQATGVDDIELVSALGGFDLDDAAESPTERLVSDEESAYIDEAIACLPDTLRSTYRVHYYEHLDNTEIAEMQGISYDNVCQRISRALKMLVAKLSGYFCSSEDTTFEKQKAKTKKPTQRASSAGSAMSATLTGRTSPDSVQMVAVVAEKQPIGEKLPPKIEPLNICKEANLSGTRPVKAPGPVTFSVSAWSCLKLAEVAPPPMDTRGTLETLAAMPEREEKSAKVDSAIASYPDKLPETYRCLDEDNLSNTQIAAEQDLSLDLVAEGISGPLNILATRLSGDLGSVEEPTGYQPTARTSVRTPHTVTHTGIKRPDCVQVEEKQPLNENSPIEKEPEKIDVVAKVSSFQRVYTPGPVLSLGTKSTPPWTSSVPDSTDDPNGLQPMGMGLEACSQYATFMAPVDELMVERWKCFPASYVMPQKTASQEAIPVLFLELARRALAQQRKTMASIGAKQLLREVIQLASISPEQLRTAHIDTS